MGQAEIFKELETKYKDDVEYLYTIYKQRPNEDKIIKVYNDIKTIYLYLL